MCCCSVEEKESESKMLLGNHRRRWKGNIKIDPQRTIWEENYQIRLARGKMARSWDYVESFHNTRKISRSAELR